MSDSLTPQRTPATGLFDLGDFLDLIILRRIITHEMMHELYMKHHPLFSFYKNNFIKTSRQQVVKIMKKPKNYPEQGPLGEKFRQRGKKRAKNNGIKYRSCKCKFPQRTNQDYQSPRWFYESLRRKNCKYRISIELLWSHCSSFRDNLSVRVHLKYYKRALN